MATVIAHVDNELCDLRAELDDKTPGIPVMHLTMKTWGVRESKCWQFVWKEFKSAISLMGFKCICAIVPEDNTKLKKFSEYIGMQEYAHINSHYLMIVEV